VTGRDVNTQWYPTEVGGGAEAINSHGFRNSRRTVGSQAEGLDMAIHDGWLREIQMKQKADGNRRQDAR
jgi:hypothetical protein